MLPSKINLKFFRQNMLWALTLALLAGCLPAAWASSLPLPVLNWQKRSDWINVKTDVTPAAFGDGVHDDTTAIQTALNRLDDSYTSTTKTVFLPKGTYRITKTLSITKVQGAMLIGTGMMTCISWGGAPNQPMFISNGSPRSRYIGLVWDGKGVASVGIEHQSNNYFETRVRHQDEAFLNFQVAGVRTGYNQVMPTAEVMFRNCQFQNCGSGAAFTAYNDYDNDFDGCHFQDCGIGINCQLGNVYIRDCNFLRSRTTDLFLCPHSHSIRRCTSNGSKQFILTSLCYSGNEVTVEGCCVDGWTGTQGAITFAARGPDTVFDCIFTHPPDSLPPIRLTNFSNGRQLVTLSNNQAPSSSQVIAPGPNSSIVTLPAGARTGSLTDTSRVFFSSAETVPPTVLDVKTGFGAKGDSHTDDTAAVLSALAAGAKQGSNTIVYFPPGVYNISGTLPIVGSNYTVGGAGFGTIIKWRGNAAGPVFAVQDPQNVTLEQVNISAPDATPCIQQTSSGAASTMTYDGVYVGGSWLQPGDVGGSNGKIACTRANRGLELIALPNNATVRIHHLDGSAHFQDCSRATILTNASFDGVIQVDGSDYDKSGFLGFLMRLSTGNPCDLVVRNNQDFVGTNFYCEQTQSHLHVSGDGSYLGQPGHVTIQGARNNTYGPPIAINDYEGRLTFTGAQFNGNQPYTITQTGTRPVSVVLLDNMFWDTEPTLGMDVGGGAAPLQNIVTSDGTDWEHVVLNSLPGMSETATASMLANVSENTLDASGPLAAAVAALDDFRQLGAVDLALNHP